MRISDCFEDVDQMDGNIKTDVK